MAVLDRDTTIKRILEYLREGNKITDMTAADNFKCYRLSGVIFNLRSYGYNIQDRWVVNENTKSRYKEYWIVE